MFFKKNSYRYSFVALALLLFICVFINISVGSIKIPIQHIWKALTFTSDVNENLNYIVIHYRLPKTIASILAGIGLGISGLLMQTYFRNPLAGPFVLGISSGSSLGVAILIMGGSFLGFTSSFFSYSIPIAASLGAFLVLSIVMITARNIRNTLSILIVGLMFGSFTSAMINILSYFSTANELQQYIFWSLGSLSSLEWSELFLLSTIIIICNIGLLFIIKPLNALLLGENYAKSLGIDLKTIQTFVFLITSLLTGSITSFVGPIAFVGLAIPHITKLIFNTSKHQVLIPAVGIIGAILLLVCDCISNIPIGNKNLPINAITSIFGAPIVVWLLISKSKRSLV